MIIAAIRLVFISFLTVVYGMSQFFCACSSTANASPISTLPSSIMSPNMMTINNSHHDMHNMPEHSKKDGEAPACEHCENQNHITATTDILDAKLFSTSTLIKTPMLTTTKAPWAHMQIIPNTLTGLRWLDPPNITPITLKNQLIA